MSLFVVATPIGNLEDLSYRAVRILSESEAVLAEDSRQTAKLLAHYKIAVPVRSVHQHTRPEKIAGLVSEMVLGKTFALVTDAGTPGVSDPGGALVAAAREAGVEVVPIPGPSAVTTLISVAGIATDSFIFLGFLPKKKGRQTLWKEMRETSLPIVIFESPYRLIKTLEEVIEFLGDRKITIGRELTKVHEEVVVDAASGLIKKFKARPPKGEIVLIIHPM